MGYIRGILYSCQSQYGLLVWGGILVSLAWSQDMTSCGGEFRGDSGRVTSPSRDDISENDNSCIYRITRTGQGGTRLYFEDPFVCFGGCHLAVYLGSSISADNLQTQYENGQGHAPAPLVVPSLNVTIVFTARHHGIFAIRYSSAEEDCDDLGGRCMDNCASTLRTYDYCENGGVCCRPDCGSTYAQDSGSFYVLGISKNPSCIFYIRRPTPGDTGLQFLSPYSAEILSTFILFFYQCGHDSLEVYTGQGTLIGSYCERSQLPESVVVPSHDVTIISRTTLGMVYLKIRYFSADETCESQGGLCVSNSCTEETDHWCSNGGKCCMQRTDETCESQGGSCVSNRCTEETDHWCSNGGKCCMQQSQSRPTCGGLYTGSGNLSSPGYPRNYDYVHECTYTFAHLESTVAVLLELLEIPDNQCRSDYLQFYDGSTTSSPSLTEKLCGHRYGLSIVSTGHYLSMEVYTRGEFISGRRRFVVTWGGINCHLLGGRCTTGSCGNWNRMTACPGGDQGCCLDDCDLRLNRICPNGACSVRTQYCDANLTPLPVGIRCPVDGRLCNDGSCIGKEFTCECSIYSPRNQTLCWDNFCSTSRAACRDLNRTSEAVNGNGGLSNTKVIGAVAGSASVGFVVILAIVCCCWRRGSERPSQGIPSGPEPRMYSSAAYTNGGADHQGISGGSPTVLPVATAAFPQAPPAYEEPPSYSAPQRKEDPALEPPPYEAVQSLSGRNTELRGKDGVSVGGNVYIL